MLQKQGMVTFIRPGSQARPAAPPQPLNFGDTLTTSNSAWAVVFMPDQSPVRLRELTRLELQPNLDVPGQPRLLLSGGQLYVVNRGQGPKAISFNTPNVKGDLRGTEFLLSVE